MDWSYGGPKGAHRLYDFLSGMCPRNTSLAFDVLRASQTDLLTCRVELVISGDINVN